jgi:hypothetical protein
MSQMTSRAVIFPSLSMADLNLILVFSRQVAVVMSSLRVLTSPQRYVLR